MKLSLSQIKEPGVAGKFILSIAMVMLLLSSIAAFIVVNLQTRAMEHEITAAEEVISDITSQQSANDRQAIEFKAQQLAKLLSTIAPQPMVEFDLSLLNRYTEMAMSDPDISFVAFVNKENRPFALSGDSDSAEKIIRKEVMNEGIKLGELRLGYNFDRATALAKKIEQHKTENFEAINNAKESALTELMFSIIGLFILIAVSTMLISFILLNRIVKRPLLQVVNATNELADGNFTARVNYVNNDELGRLADKFNFMAESVQNIIRRVTTTASNLRASSEQMSEITNTTISQVKRQHEETEQVATAMTEMATTVEEVARNTSQASQSANHANDEANQGKQVVDETIQVIQSVAREVEDTASEIARLSEHANDIGSIIDVIQSVAEQTNLLALNAAIEAARAGEQGRGFAVVADEVRTLAQRTQESTQEIEDMITRVQSSARESTQRMQSGQEKVHASVEQAQLAGQSLDKITTAVATITEMTTQIAGAAEEQSAVANDMHRHITQIRDLADKTAGSASFTESAGQALLSESDELSETIRHFQV